MTKELAMELLVSESVYLTDEGRKLLEKVVSASGDDVETGLTV